MVSPIKYLEKIETVLGVAFSCILLMMREGLLSGCDKDLKLWVQEHRPRNVNTLVELA